MILFQNHQLFLYDTFEILYLTIYVISNRAFWPCKILFICLLLVRSLKVTLNILYFSRYFIESLKEEWVNSQK